MERAWLKKNLHKIRMETEDKGRWKNAGGIAPMMAELGGICPFMVLVVVVAVAVLVGLVVVVVGLLLVLRSRGADEKLLKEL